jgi:hypothetical protein
MKPETRRIIDDAIARARKQLAAQTQSYEPLVALGILTKADIAKKIIRQLSEALRGGPVYLNVRELVFDIHFLVDGLVGYALAFYYFPKEDFESIKPLVNEIMFEVPMPAKVELLRTHKVYSPDACLKIEKLNRLRNGFAHNYPIDHPKIKPVFRPTGIDELWDDYEDIIHEHASAISRMKKSKG